MKSQEMPHKSVFGPAARGLSGDHLGHPLCATARPRASGESRLKSRGCADEAGIKTERRGLRLASPPLQAIASEPRWIVISNLMGRLRPWRQSGDSAAREPGINPSCLTVAAWRVGPAPHWSATAKIGQWAQGYARGGGGTCRAFIRLYCSPDSWRCHWRLAAAPGSLWSADSEPPRAADTPRRRNAASTAPSTISQ